MNKCKYNAPVNYGTYTAEAGVKYLLEVWGADGGNAYNRGYYQHGGQGGYGVAEVTASSATQLLIFVGGGGVGTGGGRLPFTSQPRTGGDNGGGRGSIYNDSASCGGAGGGGTDIRLTANDLNSRILVAGGGGGAEDAVAGGGGGAVGGNGGNGCTGGTAASGYAFGIGDPGGNTAGWGGGGGGWWGGTTAAAAGAGGSGYAQSKGTVTLLSSTLTKGKQGGDPGPYANNSTPNEQMATAATNGDNGKAVITQLNKRRLFVTPRRLRRHPSRECLYTLVTPSPQRGIFYRRIAASPLATRNDD